MHLWATLCAERPPRAADAILASVYAVAGHGSTDRGMMSMNVDHRFLARLDDQG